MYLRTLELYGFKSFADKTVISFRPGVNAIIGANGNGKSNISDAIRWVLGEMSPKSLRGGKMEDIIFNGTSKRRSASYAEVVMTIDNSDGLMKIDYDEVSVSRRLYRTGESEYYINKEKARLKDVVELFLNTGIGREGYSVISQGRIAEVISLKSEDRRELFEEAAGISKFRYRKTEARNKLDKVIENSARIKDLVSEIASRLPYLENQSRKAQKYIELRDEFKKLDISVWLKRRGELNKTISSVDAEYKSQSALLSQATDRLAETEAELDRLFVEAQKQNIDAEAAREELSGETEREGGISARISVLENDQRHYDTNIQRLSAELKLSEEQLGQLSAELDAVMKRAAEAESKLSIQEDLLLSASKASADAEQRLSDADAETERCAAALRLLEDEQTELRLSQRENEGVSKSRDARLKEIDAQSEQLASSRAQKAEYLIQLNESLEKAAARAITDAAEAAGAAAAGEKAAADIEAAYQSRQQKRIKLSEVTQQRESLLRMERLFEGFSGSVKEIMLAHEDGTLTGIFGPVSKLFETDDKYICAIETALGAGIQNIAVADEESAKAAIEYLKRTRSGRATFLPLTTIRPRTFSDTAIRDGGYVGLASSLIICEDKFRPVAEFLLGRTLVAGTIEDCARIAKSLSYSVRIVSLDGQIINAGGSFTGGQQLNKTGILSRNADIARFEEEIADLKRELAETDARIKTLGAAKSAAEVAARKCAESSERTKNELLTLKASVSVEHSRIADIDERAAALKTEAETLNRIRNDEENASKSAFDSRGAYEDKIREASLALEELKASKHQLDSEKAVQTKRYLEYTESCAAMRALCETENAKCAACREKIAERKTEITARSAENEIIKQKRSEASCLIEELMIERSSSRAGIDSLKLKLDALRTALADNESKTTAARQRQRSLFSQKEEKTDICRVLEQRLAAAKQEYDEKNAYMFEEYGMTDAETDSFAEGEEKDADVPAESEEKLTKLRNELKRIGSINTDALEELKEQKSRHEFLCVQLDDIEKSRAELEKLISSIEKTMREKFLETLSDIKEAFREIFTELFEGGSADIIVTNEEDILNCGIDIRVQPPGKLVKSLSLLSGGEQAFVAIALYLALLKINPSPFCVFDEIESALDEVNVFRFAEYIKRHSDVTQFIIITHRRGTMEAADILYGITMQEKGVSDFICLDTASLPGFVTEAEKNEKS
ncbi:Chromosome partition protein Smc [bioreactor metagenome]|uniref:Chromosome partition protein Smc n=1 Tax=bioreactor metagenome TaxID=1076179 RepID=A0A644XJQ7_9ZZZZ|nr:chromosome segregation protein SMC [Oscillospiraceae bacterium]